MVILQLITLFADDGSVQSWPDHVLTFNHYSILISNVHTIDSVDIFSDDLPLSFDFN